MEQAIYDVIFPMRRAPGQSIEVYCRVAAQRIAERLAKRGWEFPDDLIPAAWGIIANAGGGDWGRETPEWQEAATRWRDAYHETLPSGHCHRATRDAHHRRSPAGRRQEDAVSERRTEILSLRLSVEEKARLAEAAERHGQRLSDYARDQIVRHLDDPWVSPGQNIGITVKGVSAGAGDVLLVERIRRVLEQHGTGNWL